MLLTLRRHRPRAFVALALLLFLLCVVFTRLERGLSRLDQVLSLTRADAAAEDTPGSGSSSRTNENKSRDNSTRPGLDRQDQQPDQQPGHASQVVTVASTPTDAPTDAPTAVPSVEPIQGGVPPSDAMLDFWEDLLAALVDARPDTDETVVIDDPVNDYDMNADAFLDQTRALIDKAHISTDLQYALQAAHKRFRRSADRLSRRLPYAGKGKVRHGDAAATDGNTDTDASTPAPTPTAPATSEPTRGIVMTAGGNYIGVAVTSLLMLRRNGSKLPVQLFLNEEISGYVETLCQHVLPGLGAACHSMQPFWAATPDMPALSKFQFKVQAILFSSFREVLFLDADVWPVHSPDHLFDAEPFRSCGLVTWPDFWLPTAAPVVYDILGIPAPAVTDRRSSEAGILMYDKARHSLSLLLAAYYNFYGPDFYYPLLSQGAHGEGDKETFLHGALVAGVPFYAVHTRTGMIGRWLDGSFHSVGMKQADPVEDYELFEALQAMKSAGEALKVGLPTTTRMAYDGEEGEDEEDGGDADADLPEVDDDPDHYGTISAEEAARRQDEAETIRARSLFVHHNLYKLDVRQLGASMGNVYATDVDGQMARLWGDEAALIASAGYDVERAMWTEVGRAVCGQAVTAPATVTAACGGPLVRSKECDDFARYYEEVFGAFDAI